MSEENGSSGGSFEDRLAAARSRQGLDPLPGDTAGPPNGGHASSLAVGMRMVVELVSAVVVAVVIGIALDRWLHTMPLFLVIFLALGSAAGVRMIVRQMAVPPA